jgi:hypothetical protein
MPEHTRNTARPASEEGPEVGHTFRFTTVIRSSGRISGEKEYRDSLEFDGVPVSFEVRAWNLHDALTKAADLPFDVLMADLETHEYALDHAKDLIRRHDQFTDATGTWCKKSCPRHESECGALAVQQNG